MPEQSLHLLKCKKLELHKTGWPNSKVIFRSTVTGCTVDDDDDEGRINFSVALSPKTTRTRNNKPKQ